MLWSRWAALPAREHPQSAIVCLITSAVQPTEVARGVLAVALRLGPAFSGFPHGLVVFAGGFALLGC